MAVEIACLCGQTIYSEDRPGTQIQCVNCGNKVVVPGDASAGARPMARVAEPVTPVASAETKSAGVQELGYISRAPGDLTLTPRAFEMLGGTGIWVRSYAVVLWVSTAIMLLGGIAMTLFAMLFATEVEAKLAGPLYLILGVLTVAPSLYLWRYARHIKAMRNFRHEQNLEDALAAQKSFWKYSSLTTLILIGIYFFIVIPLGIFYVKMHH